MLRKRISSFKLYLPCRIVLWQREALSPVIVFRNPTKKKMIFNKFSKILSSSQNCFFFFFFFHSCKFHFPLSLNKEWMKELNSSTVKHLHCVHTISSYPLHLAIEFWFYFYFLTINGMIIYFVIKIIHLGYWRKLIQYIHFKTFTYIIISNG